MKLINYKVDFPPIETLLLYAVIFLCLAGIVQRSEVWYALKRVYYTISPDTSEIVLLDKQATEKRIESNDGDGPSKLQANIVTMVVWGVFGMVVYYFAALFRTVFIHPFSEDFQEAHYIHADKTYLRKKRTFWILAVFATMIAFIGIVAVFRTIVQTYLVLSAYEPTLLHILSFLAGIVICTLLAAFASLGVKVSIRAY